MIVAIDFDGILCKNEFPKIGSPNYNMISACRQLLENGHEVILWTSRVDEELTAAVDWCGEYGLHFTEVNENAPSNRMKYIKKYPNGTRKVYADIYVDDHSLEFVHLTSNGMSYKDHINTVANILKKIAKERKVD